MRFHYPQQPQYFQHCQALDHEAQAERQNASLALSIKLSRSYNISHIWMSKSASHEKINNSAYTLVQRYWDAALV
jgi:hypothetical protein